LRKYCEIIPQKVKAQVLPVKEEVVPSCVGKTRRLQKSVGVNLKFLSNSGPAQEVRGGYVSKKMFHSTIRVVISKT
jgi:hypothetical protein